METEPHTGCHSMLASRSVWCYTRRLIKCSPCSGKNSLGCSPVTWFKNQRSYSSRYIPSVLCRWPSPTGNTNSLSAEEVLKKHTVKQVSAPPFRADTASIYLRADGEIIHTTRGRRSSVERSQEWARQQTGLRCTFPLCGVQGPVTCAASLLQEVLSWFSPQWDREWSPASPSSMGEQRVFSVDECRWCLHTASVSKAPAAVSARAHEHRVLDLPLQNSQVRTSCLLQSTANSRGL